MVGPGIRGNYNPRHYRKPRYYPPHGQEVDTGPYHSNRLEMLVSPYENKEPAQGKPTFLGSLGYAALGWVVTGFTIAMTVEIAKDVGPEAFVLGFCGLAVLVVVLLTGDFVHFIRSENYEE